MSVPATVYVNFDNKHYVMEIEEETIYSFAKKAIEVHPELKEAKRANIIVSFSDVFCVFNKNESGWHYADAYPVQDVVTKHILGD